MKYIKRTLALLLAVVLVLALSISAFRAIRETRPYGLLHRHRETGSKILTGSCM